MGQLTGAQRHAQSVCNFIRKFGRRVGFPVPTLAAAQLLYHVTSLHGNGAAGLHSAAARGSAATSGPHAAAIAANRRVGGSALEAAPTMDAACATLLVAGKMQDTFKKVRDLLQRAYHYSHEGKADIDPDGDRFQRWRLRIVLLEKEIMEAIQFHFNLPLPFDFLVKLAKKAECPRPLAFRAWALLYDLYQCRVVVEYPPHILAFTALFLTARTFTTIDPAAAAALPADNPHLLTPASPEDAALALLPPALRVVLDSYLADVQSAAHIALDYLIATTDPDAAVFEVYRSIKIELNQAMGYAPAPALALAAAAAAAPPPPAAPAPAEEQSQRIVFSPPPANQPQGHGRDRDRGDGYHHHHHRNDTNQSPQFHYGNNNGNDGYGNHHQQQGYNSRRSDSNSFPQQQQQQQQQQQGYGRDSYHHQRNSSHGVTSPPPNARAGPNNGGGGGYRGGGGGGGSRRAGRNAGGGSGGGQDYEYNNGPPQQQQSQQQQGGYNGGYDQAPPAQQQQQQAYQGGSGGGRRRRESTDPMSPPPHGNGGGYQQQGYGGSGGYANKRARHGGSGGGHDEYTAHSGSRW
ncbi:hypothetical protein H9P43_005099 [Blastocladiella emersonii ATCC 22665]|nr:hypothetical protein H9P43_005099 [Blastocladiella emersonii ATCC 22665]